MYTFLNVPINIIIIIIIIIVITPYPIDRGMGYCFQSISLFVSFFLCFFVSKITRKWLDWFAWNFQERCGVTMGRPDYIFGQFQETTRCRDAQHVGGVCCAFAPQLVALWIIVHLCIVLCGWLPVYCRGSWPLLNISRDQSNSWEKTWKFTGPFSNYAKFHGNFMGPIQIFFRCSVINTLCHALKTNCVAF